MATTEPVTTLKRNASKIIANAKRTREPVVITQNGLPAVYLIDFKSYETLQTRIKILEGILQGETALREGRVLTHEQAEKKMARWLK
jgi:prevent-host-death family protein